MEEAREDLHRVLTEYELWDAPLLVLANKQDHPKALPMRNITELLQLFALSNRNWYIIDTQALHTEMSESNLHAALDWLVETLTLPATSRIEQAKLDNRQRMESQSKQLA